MAKIKITASCEVESRNPNDLPRMQHNHGELAFDFLIQASEGPWHATNFEVTVEEIKQIE